MYKLKKKDKIFSNHVTQICEVHDRVILSYLQQIHGSPVADVKGSRYDIGQNVYA